MSTWRPQPSPARTLLPAIPVLALLLALWLLSRLVERVRVVGYDGSVFLGGIAFFIAILLVGVGAYLAWSVLGMSYSFVDGGLLIRAAFRRIYIPYGSIRDVHAAGDAVEGKSVVVSWKRAASVLPGCILGEGVSPQAGRVFAVATQPASQQVYVLTKGLAYGISPQNPAGFVEELNNRIDAWTGSETDDSPVGQSRLAGWAVGFWADRTVRLLLLGGLGLNVLFWGYLSLAYNNLPIRVAIHWNSQAEIDRVGDPAELLGLPLFALAVWLFNSLAALWVLHRERATTLFLLAGAIAAQVIFFAGALSIMLKN